MRKFLFAILAAATLCLVHPGAASAANRILVYQGMNPDNNLQNENARFQRLQDGIMLRDLLGPLAPTGAWSNLVIQGGTSLSATIDNVTSNQLGAIYQFGEDDANPIPNSNSASSVEADTTQGVILAYQPQSQTNIANNFNPNPSATLSPFTPPSSAGHYYVYTIEAQLDSTSDTANGTYPFINNSGVVTQTNVPTQRTDVIVYQIANSGMPGSSNTDCSTASSPAVDTGWIGIGYLCVEHGNSNLSGLTVCTAGWDTPSGCQILMDNATNFVGGTFGQVTFGGAFAAAGNVTPSVLRTSQNNICGLSNGEGAVVDNSYGTPVLNGNHIFAADIAADFAVCGSNLMIFNQNSNSSSATITVDTATDQSTSTQEVLYPAENHTSMTTNMSCTSGSGVCSTGSGGKTICANEGSAQDAAISAAVSTAGHTSESAYLGIQQVWADPGITINPINIGGGTISSGDLIAIYYTCF